MREEELIKLIRTLRFQEGQLLEILNQEPLNEAQRKAQEKAEEFLKQLQSYLDTFIPSRTIQH